MTAYEKTLNYIKKQYDNEKDKWNCGMKNDYFTWENLYISFQYKYEKELKSK